MKKTFVVMLVIAVSLLAGGQAVQAGLNANVSADAQCTPGTFGWSELLVDAGLIQKDTLSVAPIVTQNVHLYLEQHFPGKNIWDPVNNSHEYEPPNVQPATLVAPGERYAVAVHTYGNICKVGDVVIVDPRANAVRAVVEITVDNAKNRKVYTGRCISFPNPCKQ